MSRTVRLFLIACCAALALSIAACGSDDDSSSSSSDSGGGGESGSDKASIKAGVVTDIGGLNDRGFNEAANNGRKRAQSELGAETRVLISKSNADYIPNLSQLAQQQFDMVVANGSLMGQATATVASKFPDTNFAIVDFPSADLKGKPKNVEGLLFKEQEGGYLVGYLAGLWAKDNNAKAVSTVGGQKLPAVDHYIAGFQAGAKKAFPGVETLYGYSQDFVDQAKCKEKGVQGIGVDSDQSFLGDHILTSALKKVDEAVFESIKRAQDGTSKGGTDVVGTVENGGVGIGKISAEGQKYADQIKKIQEQIAAGEIKDIPDTVE